MKIVRRLTAFLMFVLLICSASAVYAAPEETQPEEKTTYKEVDETVYAVIRVNIRTGPSTKYEILGVLPTGHSIQRIAIGENGWSKVIYQDEVAYMYTAYLSLVKPSNLQTQMDYSKLTQQIAIANGLNKGEYTRESWQVLTEALEKANDAMNSTKQETVDAAAEALKAAIDGLLKVDYTALESALETARKFEEENPDCAKWIRLVEAIAKGKVLLESGDQLASDAAATEILAALAEINTMLEQMGEPQVVVQEVEVEVPPTDDYCNMPVHYTWPVLFFVSVAVNCVLAVLAVVLYRKRKNQTDDMPLVDYNIDDDM